MTAAISRRWAFLQRVLSGAILITASAYVLFLENPLYLCLEVMFFIGLGLFEFFMLLKKDNIPLSPFWGLLMGLAIPVVVYLEFGQTQSGEILFLVLSCLFLFIIKFFRNPAQSLVGISLTLFGILYISWFLSFVIKIRFLEGGMWWVAYLIAVTKGTDIGAYAVGSLMGRHPLISHISPKKSVEGLIGGILCGVLISLAMGPYLPVPFERLHLVVLGLLMGVLGQIGDLSESLMK